MYFDVGDLICNLSDHCCISLKLQAKFKPDVRDNNVKLHPMPNRYILNDVGIKKYQEILNSPMMQQHIQWFLTNDCNSSADVKSYTGVVLEKENIMTENINIIDLFHHLLMKKMFSDNVWAHIRSISPPTHEECKKCERWGHFAAACKTRVKRQFNQSKQQPESQKNSRVHHMICFTPGCHVSYIKK